MKSRSLVLMIFGIIGFTLAGPLPCYSADYTTDLTFETTDQSMWGKGGAIVYDFNYFIGPEWGPVSGDIGGVAYDVTTPSFTLIPRICIPFIGCTPAVTVPAVNLGDYGLEIGGSTDGRVGFELDFALDSGSVDVSYPVDISIDFPDPATVNPGETFTISTAYTADPAASMMTNFPEASLGFDFIFDVYANAYGAACLVDCFWDGDIFTIDIDERIPLIDIDSNTAEVTFDILGYAQMTAQIPDIDTTASLAGNNLVSEGEDGLLEVYVDIDQIATTLLGLPPLDGSVDFGIGGIDYNILDILVGAILNVTQDFTFDPGLLVEFALSTGETFEVAVGDSIDIVMPNSYDPLLITPTFMLDNLFTNMTGLRIDPAFIFELLSFTGYLDFPSTVNLVIPDPSLTLGPLFAYDTSIPGLPIPLLDNSWPLLGFPEFTTASFEVVPIPEPGTLLLFGMGLLGTAVYGRRRMKSKLDS